MKSSAVILFLLFYKFSFSQEMSVSSGNLKVFPRFKSDFVDSRTVAVWLPNDYSEKQKYAVIYLQDGQNLFDSTTTWNGQSMQIDEVLGELLAEKKVKNCIVVGIWNNGDFRHSEYFPERMIKNIPATTRKIVLEEQLKNRARADDYLLFLTKELKPFIDKSFSTKPTIEATFIGGASMGGLLSLYAMCEYPKVFGGAICMSTHLPMTRSEKLAAVVETDLALKFRDYLSAYLPDPKSHKLYMDYGDQTLDQYYKFFQDKVDVVLTSSGYNSENWITKFFPGDDHSEKSWSKRIHIPLEFMFKIQK